MKWRVPREQALAAGFTHEGTQYGIPIYWKDVPASAETEWEPSCEIDLIYPWMVPLLWVCDSTFILLNSLLDEPVGFAFKVRPIEQDSPYR